MHELDALFYSMLIEAQKTSKQSEKLWANCYLPNPTQPTIELKKRPCFQKIQSFDVAL